MGRLSLHNIGLIVISVSTRCYSQQPSPVSLKEYLPLRSNDKGTLDNISRGHTHYLPSPRTAFPQAL